MTELVEKLEKQGSLSEKELTMLIEGRNEAGLSDFLFERARAVRERYYGKDIYVRGLVEFSNFCKNDCYYCGIRRSNKDVSRYRLSEDEIFECCEKGYDLGFRTFVLQGGEDPWYDEKRIESLVKGIKKRFSDCAVTLSVGEHPKEAYKRWFEAGADRFLLRHETADDVHYRALHPEELSLENRKRCLYDLKELGYQVGCGFMVGSPFQKTEHIVKDLLFIKDFSPDMVGIGPFIPCRNTPFEKEKAGTLELTVFLLAVVRLMNPTVLLPATTALASIDPVGREKGILAGANVCMPNLSPQAVRGKYNLYDGKANSGSEAAEALAELSERVKKIGYNVVISRGDRIKA